MTSPPPVIAPHLSFWGKAQPDTGLPYPPWHPVAHHLLDVAAAMDALLRCRPMALERGARLLAIGTEETRTLLISLAVLHDLGKFSPAFQAKVPDLWPAALVGLDPHVFPPGRHTDDGFSFWHEFLGDAVVAQLWPGAYEALHVLAPAVFGHHGRPVGARPRPVSERFRSAAARAATACAVDVLAVVCPAPIDAPAPDERRTRRASWWVAGLMTLADWIGSGQRWFRYTAPSVDPGGLADYWDQAREAAARAVREAGLVTPPMAGPRTFSELTGLDRPPSPAQRWAESVPLPEGPALFVLEDVTGAGKTEAAQVLVHRLMTARRAAGAYWAMPTQATTNAMYARQARTIGALFADAAEPRPSLVLAHGQQRLHDGFRATVLDGAAAGAGDGEIGEDAPGTVACASFLADDRRAALLADVGAGTIDQALLAVLPSRFGALRLFALADKVLVIDEAHAYDAYMGVEIQELLRFHAALGGSAVVLSATLPRRQREGLVRAWLDGAGTGTGHKMEAGDILPPPPDDYPLATVAAVAAAETYTIEAAPWSCRSVAVRLVHEARDALGHVLEAARQGGAALWVRNSVDDCLEAAQALRDAGAQRVLVFHARFAQCDRQRREQEVLARFGKEAEQAERAGWILVATQVVEQSLDLDFDAMVSDLAPIDLLVQRAGRLWRHGSRDDARPAACRRELLVLSPVPSADPPRDWLGGTFARTARVYDDAGVLWRTVQTLTTVGAIRTPEGLRSLIEPVYGSAEVPEALQASADRAEGKSAGHAATARYGTLKVGHGYDPHGEAWLGDLRVPTRLGDEQTTVRLARLLPGGGLAPWAADRPAWKGWALSEIRLRATRVPFDAAPPPEYAAAAAAARAQWGRFEQDLPLLPLREAEPGVWRGELRHPSRPAPLVFRYSEDTGLAFGAA